MDLTFRQQGNVFVTEFEATSDFNLHIEKGRGSLQVLQSSVAGGGYDGVRGARMIRYDDVFDSDFTALVYPKYIKVVAETKPTLAVVTFAK